MNNNSWALITGASVGIGREFVWQYASRGYNLVLVARTASALAELKTEVQNTFNVERDFAGGFDRVGRAIVGG